MIQNELFLLRIENGELDFSSLGYFEQDPVVTIGMGCNDLDLVVAEFLKRTLIDKHVPHFSTTAHYLRDLWVLLDNIYVPAQTIFTHQNQTQGISIGCGGKTIDLNEGIAISSGSITSIQDLEIVQNMYAALNRPKVYVLPVDKQTGHIDYLFNSINWANVLVVTEMYYQKYRGVIDELFPDSSIETTEEHFGPNFISIPWTQQVIVYNCPILAQKLRNRYKIDVIEVNEGKDYPITSDAGIRCLSNFAHNIDLYSELRKAFK